MLRDDFIDLPMDFEDFPPERCDFAIDLVVNALEPEGVLLDARFKRPCSVDKPLELFATEIVVSVSAGCVTLGFGLWGFFDGGFAVWPGFFSNQCASLHLRQYLYFAGIDPISFWHFKHLAI